MGETLKPKFNQPMAPDKYTGDLYGKYGLSETPSLAEVEEKATELLGSPLTMLDGAALVMGREVLASETDLLRSIFVPTLTGAERFASLLVIKSIEELKSNSL